MKSDTADISITSRDLREKEKQNSFKETLFAKSAMKLIVNKDVNIDGLSLEQVRKIYKGDITNWKDIGLADETIQVVCYEGSTNERGVFDISLGFYNEDSYNHVKGTITLKDDESIIEYISKKF